MNAYGPTETTVCATIATCTDTGRPPPIGRPIANTQVYLLDRYLQPVPVGVPGEIYIGGVGLAWGYLNRPDLTAERFVPSSWSVVSGQLQRTTDNRQLTTDNRLYRTGDLARYLPDGQIEFLGRIDRQVKLRGFRIELEEIETVLGRHPAIQAAALLLREDHPGEHRLVAYIVPVLEDGGSRIEDGQVGTDAMPSSILDPPSSIISELRAFLKEHLPDYMIPSTFVSLAALPLTPNGKIDWRALPSPDQVQSTRTERFVAPRTPTEERLAEIWCKLLHLDRVGIHDNFFAAGGHSLLVMQVLASILNTWQIDLPLQHFFAQPTIAMLASIIDTSVTTDPDLYAPIQPVGRDRPLPLSFAQQRFWFLERMAPGSPLYTIATPLLLRGTLDLAALSDSLEALVARHEILRTCFPLLDDQPVQRIESSASIALEQLDLSALDPASRAAAVPAHLASLAARPFDLAQSPPARWSLLRLTADQHILLLCVHHIIMDGWSFGVLLRELATLYNAAVSGQAAVLPALPIQYADYAAWQREWLQGAVLEQHENYWKQQLQAPLPLLNLPTDHPRPAVQSFRGAQYRLVVTKQVTDGLASLSRQSEVTLFMTLLAAFNVLLSRLSGQSDIVLGTPVAGRTRQESEPLLGCFVNTLVLRTDLSGQPSFRELLGRVRTVCLEAFAHQELPFEQLVELLQPQRDTSRSPLFQVLFSLQPPPANFPPLHGLELGSLEIDLPTARLDLVLGLLETEQGLEGVIEYSTDLFDSTTIERMAGHFQTLLAAIVAEPGQPITQLPLLPPAERAQLLAFGVAPHSANGEQRCVHQLFEAQVERTPDAIAAILDERLTDGARPENGCQQLTYRELERRADQLANYLRSIDVGPAVHVGIYLDRSLELIVGLLGVLKAGGAYVPLDPSYPEERLAFMLADADVAVLLTSERLAPGLAGHVAHAIRLDSDWAVIARAPAQKAPAQPQLRDPAYLIYTSGSTGRPKGVQVEHGQLLHTLIASQVEFGFQVGDRMPLLASAAFDIALFELFNPLLAGGTVVVLSADHILDMPQLVATLADCTAVHAVPSLMKQIVEKITAGTQSRPAYDHLRAIFVGGDTVPPALLTELQAVFRHATVWVLYGPTEAAIIVTRYQVPRDRPHRHYVIGAPLPGTQVYLTDQYAQLVPLGVPGEIVLGGEGITRGYLNRPGLTAERFVPNPFVQERLEIGDWRFEGAQSPISNLQSPISDRLYRTGDLARFRPDGTLEFLGRIDQQVKVRGFRIELGEIEATLQRHSGVREAVAVARPDSTGEQQIVAYVVPSDQQVELSPSIGEYFAYDDLIYPRDYQATPFYQALFKHDRTPLRPDQGDAGFAVMLHTYLAQTLPAAMVPAAFVLLDALPLNPNGKINRRALPAPDAARPASERPFVGPRDSFEASIAAIWADILGVERVSVHDNFFMIGGHSLSAIQVVSRLRDCFGLEVPVRTLFELPTIAELGARLTKNQLIMAGVTISSQPRSIHRFPLAFAQQRLWFLEQLTPGTAAYNIPFVIGLTGSLHVAAFSHALDTIVGRHEILRTSFPVEDGQPLQCIAPPAPVPLPLVDLRALPPEERAVQMRALI